MGKAPPGAWMAKESIVNMGKATMEKASIGPVRAMLRFLRRATATAINVPLGQATNGPVGQATNGPVRAATPPWSRSIAAESGIIKGLGVAHCRSNSAELVMVMIVGRREYRGTPRGADLVIVMITHHSRGADLVIVMIAEMTGHHSRGADLVIVMIAHHSRGADLVIVMFIEMRGVSLMIVTIAEIMNNKWRCSYS